MKKGTESSRLAAFLLALQTSQSAKRRFRKDPKAEMHRFDLSPKTIRAVTKGDAWTLWIILTRVPGHVGTVIHQVGAVVRRERKHRKHRKK